ncbi:hypothetical protein Sango_2994800 [Sesamum angolense]|uniref:Retrovirus-related Pol polyprotein from transposon TNT 1-94-like beta-barrel domain-containing protein n=1 Tax=Sesamum angolense TaxID=2727404 RepID=A0AAE1VT06_9LAMI|nr:hypothetical protein Sango_2994800 [Sesamum angolense]
MTPVEQKTTLGTTVTFNEWANTVTLRCEEYEQLLHRPVANSATSSSLDAFIASHGESRMIDSGATSHLTDNRSHFLTLSTSPKFLPVRLADRSYSPISGFGIIQPTDNLTLTDVLFAISVKQLTKTHNCSVTFYPSYCVIQDLQTRRTIGSDHERGGLYFLDTTPTVDARALSASVSSLQWYSRLGYPSLPT